MHPRASLRVERFDVSRRDDFYRLHSATNGAGWCRCVAWWVPTWQEWGYRTAEKNLAFREQLLSLGHYDGYLAYDADTPVGWCQVGRRDRLMKVRSQFALAPSPETWAITCFFIAPSHRRRGVARTMLREILIDLRNRGIRRIEAFPKRGEELSPREMWMGPESLFLEAGFRPELENALRPILVLDLKSGPRKFF